MDAFKGTVSKMKRIIPYSEARRVLMRVPAPVSFWLCTNENLRSLSDLASALEEADNDVFRYHVSRDRNDFEAWIRDIVKDKELAREIARVKTKETLIRKINERVEALRVTVKRHQKANARKKPIKNRKKGRTQKRSGKKAGRIRAGGKQRGKRKLRKLKGRAGRAARPVRRRKPSGKRRKR